MTRMIDEAVWNEMTGDCQNCCGLCCVVLYFSKADGFPADKPAGAPCENLTAEFGCAVHSELKKRGMGGCVAYDCFGAGQRVTRETFAGRNWRTHPETAQQMYAAFLTMRELCQLRWYLTEASARFPAGVIGEKLAGLLEENERLTRLDADALCALRLDDFHARVRAALRETAALAANPYGGAGKRRGGDCMGKNFKGADLSGRDFTGALLIAANLEGCKLRDACLLGADLRDANLRGADLGECLFLTRWQLASARGDRRTKLPRHLSHPENW